jgi:hypothetical protein
MDGVASFLATAQFRSRGALLQEQRNQQNQTQSSYFLFVGGTFSPIAFSFLFFGHKK